MTSCAWPAQACAIALAALAATGCSSCSDPVAVETVPQGMRVKTASVDPHVDAIAFIAARLPSRTGSCAQVRSVQDEAEALKLADAIRTEQALAVDVVRADLGAKGTWFRLCVGEEDSEARLIARATRWTSPRGVLEEYLDPPVEGSPRFHVLTRNRVDARRATLAQARGMLHFDLVTVPPAAKTAEGDAGIRFFGGPAKDALLLAATAHTEDSSTDVVVVDAAGRRLALSDSPPPGCAGCTLALREGRVRARRQVAAGDVAPLAGDELLVEEETHAGIRFLSLMAAENGVLVRIAGLVLEGARPGYAQLGKAVVVEADSDPYREIVLATQELRMQASGAGQTGEVACDLETHAVIYDLGAAGFVRLDPLKMPAVPHDAVANVVTALDEHGDHDAASRACAAQLGREPQAATAQLCLLRVRRLIDDGALVDAVNAAGLAAEAQPSLRPVFAASFHAAVTALDGDARLFVGEADCARSPLADALNTRALSESMRIAAAKQRERVALGDVADAVFVTGIRDFGPSSPVGVITARWLARLQSGLPAKAAAVEALLLPQAPDPVAPSAELPDDASASAGFGGAP